MGISEPDLRRFIEEQVASGRHATAAGDFVLIESPAQLSALLQRALDDAEQAETGRA